MAALVQFTQPIDLEAVDLSETDAANAQVRKMDILKPYVLLASVAFTIGFTGYWTFGRIADALTTEPAAAVWQAPVSAETPQTIPRNPTRHI